MVAFSLFRKVLKEIFLWTLTTILTLFVFIPSVILIYLPLRIYSKFVGIAGSFFVGREKWFGLLEPSDSHWVGKDYVFSSAFYLNGPPLDISELENLVQENLLTQKDCEGTYIPKNEKLTCTIQKFMGLYYWKRLGKDFNVKNHVKLIKGNAHPDWNNPESIAKFLSDLCKTRASSFLWEILLCPHDTPRGGGSVVIALCNHTLSDGFGWFFALKGMLPGGLPCSINSKPVPGYPTRLAGYIRTPFDGIRTLLDDALAFSTQPACPANNPSKSANLEPSPSWDIIARLKTRLGVSTNSIVLSGMAGALRKRLHAKNIPSKVTVILPVMLPGHTGSLQNYSIHTVINLPIGETNSIKRTLLIDKELRPKRPGWPHFLRYIRETLPPHLWTRLETYDRTIAFNNLIGTPETGIQVLGRNLLAIQGQLHVCKGLVPALGLAMTRFGDNLVLSGGGRWFRNYEEACQFTKDVLEGMQSLEQELLMLDVDYDEAV